MAQDGAIQSVREAILEGRWRDAMRALDGTEAGPQQDALRLWLHATISDPIALSSSIDSFDARGDSVAAVIVARVAGRVAAASLDVDDALFRYDGALALAKGAQYDEEICLTQLEAAEVLMDRGGPSDSSAAAARLADARDHAGAQLGVQVRLQIALQRARGAAGDIVGALRALDELRTSAPTPALRAKVEMVVAELHESRGEDFASKASAQRGIELLEQCVLTLPTQHRGTFWSTTARRALRERANSRQTKKPATDTDRELRLLDIMKRLASERDHDRLLERITDAAVELSGAERGFVLLPGDDGKLEPKLVRAMASADDPSVAFSRSIAEAVWIDGEPLVTVDAQGDGRLSEYLSVHKLMLRSVASLPIRSRDEPLSF